MPFRSLFRRTRRLCVVVGLPLLTLGPLAIFAYGGMRVIGVDARAAEQVRMAHLAELSALEADVTQATLRLQQAALARSAAEAEATLGDVAADRRRMEQAATLGPGPHATPAEREQPARLPTLMARFREHHGETVHLVRADRRPEASEMLALRALPASQELLAELANTIRFEQYRLQADLRQIGQAASGTLYVLASLAVFTMVGLMLFADRFVALFDALNSLQGALTRAAALARTKADAPGSPGARMARQASVEARAKST